MGKEENKKDKGPPHIYALELVDKWNRPSSVSLEDGKAGGRGWYWRPRMIVSEYIRVVGAMKQNSLPPPGGRLRGYDCFIMSIPFPTFMLAFDEHKIKIKIASWLL